MSIKHIIPEGYKIRVIALGCGVGIVNDLFGDGASKYLHSVELSYSRESTDNYCGEEIVTSYVSLDVLDKIHESEYDLGNVRDNVINIYLTATLAYDGQREGRVNQVHVLYVKGDSYIREYETHVFKTTNRVDQENEIVNVVKNIINRDIFVIYAGSFNPAHAGHIEVYKILKNKYGFNNVEFQISKNHPVKGCLSYGEISRRFNSILDVTGGDYADCISVVDSPTYKEKYLDWVESQQGSELIFAIGCDVWDTLKDDFENDFLEYNNVKFLVFNRGGNKVRELNSPLLHRLSFTEKMKNSKLSSTKIREEIKS